MAANSSREAAHVTLPADLAVPGRGNALTGPSAPGVQGSSLKRVIPNSCATGAGPLKTSTVD